MPRSLRSLARALPALSFSLWLALLAGCGASGGTSARPTAPAGDPAGRRLDEWLAAINAADPEGLKRFHSGMKDPDQRAAMDLQLAQLSGGFEVRKILASTPTERMALIRAKKTGRWRCLKFGIEAEPPHRLAVEMLPPVDPPADEKAVASLPPFDDQMRREVVDALARELERVYVFADKGAEMANTLRAKEGKHAYDGLGRVGLELALSEEMKSVSHDRHLQLRAACTTTVPPAAPPAGQPAPAAAGPHPPPGGRPGGSIMFGESRRLDGNVAYVDITTFDAEIDVVRDEINRTMNAAADAAAIIIDLRRNNGGMPKPVTLVSSHLLGKDPVHLGSTHWRATNKTDDFFSDPNLPGPKFGPDKPVYVLTSGFTFSAGEAFAYNLQALKRAVIVGEKTGGGAHPGDVVSLPHGFTAFIPMARSINPITKTDWEGVGVKPDVEVPADKALDKALELARERTIR